MKRVFLAGLLAMFAADVVHATAVPDAPESICDLPATRDGVTHHVRAPLIMHMHGSLLRDPRCPEKYRVPAVGVQIMKVIYEVDPDGERFGIPPGAGTWSDVELEGEVGRAHEFVVTRMVGYRLHHVIDAAWRDDADDFGPGSRERRFDAALALAGPAQHVDVNDPSTYVGGNLKPRDVAALLEISLKDPPVTGEACDLTWMRDSYAQVQCHRSRGCWSDEFTWVFTRDGESWRLVKRTDGFVR